MSAPHFVHLAITILPNNLEYQSFTFPLDGKINNKISLNERTTLLG